MGECFVSRLAPGGICEKGNHRLEEKDIYTARSGNKTCKPCRRERARKYRSESKYIKAHTQYVRRWRLNNPLKYKAHTLVNNAIRDGRVIRPKQCDNCSVETNLHGHHKDYNLPLLVEWLCDKCHQEKHIEFEHREIYANE